MEPSNSKTSGHKATIQCLLNWLLPDKEESYDPLLRDCSIALLSFENFWTSVLVCFFFVLLVLVMLTTSCCLFLWWQKKKRRIVSDTTTNLVVKPKRSAKNANTPIIRSQDIISFVLPSHAKKVTNQYPLVKLEEETRTTNTNNLSVSSATGLRGSNSSLDPSNLNLKLYSPGQETNENVHIDRAKIGVSLKYDPSCQQLTLKILGALNLPSKNKNMLPNPYVKIIILPGRHIKCTTRTLKSNCNPLFNQIFELDMSGLMLKETEILLVVRDQQTAELTRYVQHDTYERCVSRSVTLGQAVISLVDFEELTTRRQVRWCLLEDASSPTPPMDITDGRAVKGEMLVTLRYDPQYGRMIIGLMELRLLPTSQENNKEKMTIKVLLYERGYFTSSRRTSSIRRDEATAVLGEKFVFALQPNVLHEASCQLVLVTKSAIGIKRTLGRITLGHRHFFSTWANSTALTTGIDHWHDMSHRPGVTIQRWHPFL